MSANYEGIRLVAPGKYQVRVKRHDAATGKQRNRKATITGTIEDAIRARDELRAEMADHTEALLELDAHPISDAPGYWITRSGVVYSSIDGAMKPLKQVVDMAGYLRVRMKFKGRKTWVPVHKLLGVTFIGPRPPGHQMRHLNGYRHDNRLENLSWGTAKENAADTKLHRATRQGTTFGPKEQRP